jgi:hypothetical protein
MDVVSDELILMPFEIPFWVGTWERIAKAVAEDPM